jgi:hypothetical protein
MPFPAIPLKTLGLLDEITAFCQAKLEHSTRNIEPFPHLYLPKLLPKAFFDEICRLYPTSECMESMPARRTGNPYAHKYRRLLNLNEETLSQLAPEQSRFWTIFLQLAERIGPSMLAALPTPTDDHKYLTIAEHGLKTRVDLWADHGGYQIAPHTDAPHKLATFLLYCSPNPELAREGTSIFVPREKNRRCWLGKQWPLEEFHEVFRAHYGPNCLFGFRKTDRSFHGKFPVSVSTIERRTIAITVQVEENYVA